MANQQHPHAEKLPSNADHAAPTSWEAVQPDWEGVTWYWLTTQRPVFLVSVDGALYFCSNESTRKGKNLIRNSQAVIAAASDKVHLV